MAVWIAGRPNQRHSSVRLSASAEIVHFRAKHARTMDIGESETAAQLYLHASRLKPVSTLGIPLIDTALLQSPRVIEISGDEGMLLITRAQ